MIPKSKILGFALFLSPLLAGPKASGKEVRWTHFGLRPLAMGNAFVAVADDYNALFYNPAGLARLTEWDGELLNPTLESAGQTISFVNKLMDMQGGSQKTSELLDLFKEQIGQTHHMGLYWTPHLVAPHWGLGIGLALPFSLVTHNNINITVDTGLRLVAPLGFAFNFLEKRLSLGAAVKLLSRVGVDHSFTIDSISAVNKDDGLKELAEGGYAYGFDFGLLFTPIKVMEPTLGVSLTDLGGSVYTPLKVSDKEAHAPAARLPAVNTGVSLKPLQTDRMYLLTALDAHVINQPIHYSHKFNMGLEWGYGQILKVQAGLKEGYLTAGFQFDVGLLNLRFTTYAVDHATIVGSADSLVERRYAFQMKLII